MSEADENRSAEGHEGLEPLEESVASADDEGFEIPLPPLDEREEAEVAEDAVFGARVGDKLVESIGEAFAERRR